MLFWPGLWAHGAYMYPYYTPYNYYNRTSGKNETKPVQCACDPEVECGCDDDGNSTAVLDELVGDGDYNKLNHTQVTVANYKGNDTILINGTLPNGTTAPGGDEDAFSAASGLRFMAETAGWWPVVATVCALVWAA